MTETSPEQRISTFVRTHIDAINVAHCRGHTPLSWSCRYERGSVGASLVVALISAGAQVNLVDRYGRPPIYYAIESGNAHIVRVLIEAGADVNVPVSRHRTTPLIAAVLHTRRDAEDIVLQRGMSGFQGVKRSSPEDTTSAEGIASALIAAGARVNDADHLGQTALYHAANLGSVPFVHLLLAAGADLSIANASGWAPIHVASALGRTNALRLLLGAGATLSSPDPDTRTPIVLAIKSSHVDTVKALLDEGATIDPGSARALFRFTSQESITLISALVTRALAEVGVEFSFDALPPHGSPLGLSHLHQDAAALMRSHATLLDTTPAPPPVPARDDFDCLVCLETHDSGLGAISRCGHAICRYALWREIESKGPLNAMLTTSCYDCRAPVPFNILKSIAPDVMGGLRRVIETRDRSVAACPACTGGWATGGSAAAPALVCNSPLCAKTFCFLHGRACATGGEDVRPGGAACAAFETARAPDAPTATTLKNFSVRCPGCGCPVHRNGGGCNIIDCLCGATFCYGCGAPWSSGHFNCQRIPSSSLSGEDLVRTDVLQLPWVVRDPPRVRPERISRGAIHRVRRELRALIDNPIVRAAPGPIVRAGDAIIPWQDPSFYPTTPAISVEIMLLTAPESPFEGTGFRVELTITHRYPFDPIDFRFIDKPHHPNISLADGRICDGLIFSGIYWSPASTFETCIVTVQNVLGEPILDMQGVVNIDAAEQFARGEWPAAAAATANRWPYTHDRS
jgi:ankyrin repeat protein/ubiquitin-protein ligase